MKAKAVAEKFPLIAWVFQDWGVNGDSRASQVVVASFRFAQWADRHFGRLAGLVCVPYEFLTALLIGVELNAKAEVGPRLRVYHPQGIVLHPRVTMGRDCILRQNVTIGNVTRRDGSEKGVASIGDEVEFGAGCVVVGDIHVGNGARIGALALVRESVPDRGVMVGNPAQLVRIDDFC